MKKFFLEGDASKLNAAHLGKLKRMLLRLNNASEIKDLNVPGWRLHKLKGDLKNHYAIDVSGNYRLIFHFENGEVSVLDYIDYH